MMYKSKRIGLVLATAVALALASSCGLFFSNAGKVGSLSIAIQGEAAGARTILPSAATPNSYLVRLTRSGHTEMTAKSTAAAIMVPNIAVGIWTLVVEAYSDTSSSDSTKPIGKSVSTDVIITDGIMLETLVAILPVADGSGNGRLKVSYTWPSTLADSASIEIAKLSAPTVAIAIPSSHISKSAGAASIDTTLSSAAVDPYIVRLKLSQNGSAHIPFEELAHIYENLTSEKSIAITASQLTSPPDAPGALAVTMPDSGTFALAWADLSATEEGFRIYRNGTKIADIAKFSTTYSDTSFGNNEATTAYEVRAVNRFGESAGSAKSVSRVASIAIPALVIGETSGERALPSFTPSAPTFANLTWASANSAIATVDQAGIVWARRAGTVNITATSRDGSKVGTCALTVASGARIVNVNFQRPGSLADDLRGTLAVNSAASPSEVLVINGPEGFDSYEWKIDGVMVPGATLDTFSRTGTGLSTGSHTITLVAKRGSIPYTRDFVYSITNVTDPVTADKDALVLSAAFAPGDGASSVKGRLELPSVGANGSDIRWSSSPLGVIDPSGGVTRPSSGSGPSTVTMTATITKGGTTTTKEFTLTVPAAPAAEADAINEDFTRLRPSYSPADSSGSVTGPLVLDSMGGNGSTIVWSSVPAGIVASDGSLSRPAEQDTRVIMTAAITNGATTVLKTFPVTVLKAPISGTAVVAADAAVIKPLFAAGDGTSAVRGDLVLPRQGPAGGTIAWTASPTGTIDEATGKVTRPFVGGDKEVTLTATITKDGEVTTKTVTVIVKAAPTTESEKADADAASLVLGFNSGDSPGAVTGNIGLPSTGTSGSAITWSSSAPTVIASNGGVTRPSGTGSADIVVTLTATIRNGGTVRTKTFTLTVKRILVSDTAAVAADIAALPGTIVYTNGGTTPGDKDTKDSVTGRFELPQSGDSGTLIHWVPSDGDICKFPASPPPVYAPIPVEILRPAVDTNVTLTGTVSKGGASGTSTVTVRVKGNGSLTEAEKAAEDAKPENLVRLTTFSPGDTKDIVTDDFTLPGKGPNGTIITWERPIDETICRFPPTMPAPGSPVPVDVERPSSGDVDVNLKGTATSGGTSAPTTTVSVKVKKSGASGSLRVTVSFTRPSEPAFSLPADQAVLNKTLGQTLAVSVAEGFQSYAWKLDDGAKNWSTREIVVNSSELLVGKHWLRIIVTSGGVSYSSNYSFGVVER